MYLSNMAESTLQIYMYINVVIMRARIIALECHYLHRRPGYTVFGINTRINGPKNLYSRTTASELSPPLVRIHSV